MKNIFDDDVLKGENKLTAERKKEIIEAVTDDILNDKEFIYESMEHSVAVGRGDKMLTFATMILKNLKRHGASDKMLKQCYEIATRDELEAIKYMLDTLQAEAESIINDKNND